jgi:hypothetical protein
MWVGVAREEVLQPQHVAVMARAEQKHAAIAVPDVAHPPQDIGPHDDLADIRLGRDQAPEIGAFDPNDAAIRSGAAAHQNFPVVEEIHLARELAGAMHCNRAAASEAVFVEDFDRAIQQQEEVDPALAALVDHATFRDLLFRPVTSNPVHHLGLEQRIGLRLPQIGVAGIEIRHGSDERSCHESPVLYRARHHGAGADCMQLAWQAASPHFARGRTSAPAGEPRADGWVR